MRKKFTKLTDVLVYLYDQRLKDLKEITEDIEISRRDAIGKINSSYLQLEHQFNQQLQE